MSFFERFIALRLLRMRKKERFASLVGVFALVGIALGVGTLIVVMSVMSGFKSDLTGRVLGLHGDLNVYGVGGQLENWQSYIKPIQSVKGVTRITPISEGTVLFQQSDYATGVLLQGVQPADIKNWKVLSQGVLEGDWDELNEPGGVAVGVDLAQRAHLSLGSRVTVLSAQGRSTVMGTVPRVMKGEVKVIFDADWNDYNSNVVISSLKTAQNFFLAGDKVSYIQVQTQDPLTARRTARKIGDAIQHSGNQAKVMDWTQSANGFLEAVTVEENVMFLILSLIILVAAFNVISSMTMIVQEKKRDIAVLRGLGMTKAALMRSFFICGATIGVVGTFVGAILGIGFALNIDRIKELLENVLGISLFNPEIYFLSHLPAKLIWHDVFEVIGFALLISFIATLYPAWKAASTDPVEILRNEG